jgi:gamma-glutamylcyclotransferase (GGCT)/AIG2-like uncharacterized protein YtfP
VGGDAPRGEARTAGAVTLHFAYGSNMSRAVMRRHARDARPLGAAELLGYRFLITGDGFASVEPEPAQSVHGVLWRITPRDRVTLDRWEDVDGGLYRAVTLAVCGATGRVPALVYRARPRGEGRPKPGYIELVIAAAREWNLPDDYIGSLQDWSPRRSLGAGTRKIGEFR